MAEVGKPAGEVLAVGFQGKDWGSLAKREPHLDPRRAEARLSEHCSHRLWRLSEPGEADGGSRWIDAGRASEQSQTPSEADHRGSRQRAADPFLQCKTSLKMSTFLLVSV